MQPISATYNNFLSIALGSMESSSKSQDNERWHNFEDILQGLHAEGIFIHPEQLAEFLLAHGLPVHLRYVPAHLRDKAIELNENYQGDMVRVVEEPEPPYWDFSWMDKIQIPHTPTNQSNQTFWIQEQEQPFWDYP
jgi:hypothetical protein